MRFCLIDGEAVSCDKKGIAVFELPRRKPTGEHVFMYAFDLLELDGQDLRREPLETRKAALASLLRGCRPGVRLNEHLEHQDPLSSSDTLAPWASKASSPNGSAQSIVAADRRTGSEMKNPAAPAVKREAEEEWGKERCR